MTWDLRLSAPLFYSTCSKAGIFNLVEPNDLYALVAGKDVSGMSRHRKVASPTRLHSVAKGHGCKQVSVVRVPVSESNGSLLAGPISWGNIPGKRGYSRPPMYLSQGLLTKYYK